VSERNLLLCLTPGDDHDHHRTDHPADLADRYADTVRGVRSIYNRREGTFPQVKS